MHPELMSIVRSLLHHLLLRTKVAVLKVASHAGQLGKERADTLADREVRILNRIGRHAAPVRSPLPPINSQNWLTSVQDIEAQAIALAQALQIAAEALAPPEPDKYIKEYLSSATKTLIGRVDATPATDTATLSKLRKAVRMHARKDKRQHLCHNLLEDSRGPPSQQWRTLKYVRKPHTDTPKTQGVEKPNGTLCSQQQKLQALAQHLAGNVWHPSQEKNIRTTALSEVADVDLGPFMGSELDRAIHRIRTRKSPGPDKIAGELLKYASRNFKRLLLDHYNTVFFSGIAPGNWKLSEVIMISKGKKKDPRSPRSYRPISLVNTIYKIYASMLRHRLKQAVDRRLSPAQFEASDHPDLQPLHYSCCAGFWSCAKGIILHFIFSF